MAHMLALDTNATALPQESSSGASPNDQPKRNSYRQLRAMRASASSASVAVAVLDVAASPTVVGSQAEESVLPSSKRMSYRARRQMSLASSAVPVSSVKAEPGVASGIVDGSSKIPTASDAASSYKAPRKRSNYAIRRSAALAAKREAVGTLQESMMPTRRQSLSVDDVASNSKQNDASDSSFVDREATAMPRVSRSSYLAVRRSRAAARASIAAEQVAMIEGSTGTAQVTVSQAMTTGKRLSSYAIARRSRLAAHNATGLILLDETRGLHTHHNEEHLHAAVEEQLSYPSSPSASSAASPSLLSHSLKRGSVHAETLDGRLGGRTWSAAPRLNLDSDPVDVDLTVLRDFHLSPLAALEAVMEDGAMASPTTMSSVANSSAPTSSAASTYSGRNGRMSYSAARRSRLTSTSHESLRLAVDTKSSRSSSQAATPVSPEQWLGAAQTVPGRGADHVGSLFRPPQRNEPAMLRARVDAAPSFPGSPSAASAASTVSENASSDGTFYF